MRVFISLFLALGMSNVYAAAEVISTVDIVRVDENGWGLVRFTTPLGMQPASCIQNHPTHLSFDTNTDGGKAILGLALTAHSTGKRLFAGGTGTCEGYGIIEKWNIGWIINE